MIHIHMPWRLCWIGSNCLLWALAKREVRNEQKAIYLTAAFLLPLLGSPLMAWFLLAIWEEDSLEPFSPFGWLTLAAVVGWYSLGIMTAKTAEQGVFQAIFTAVFNAFVLIFWLSGSSDPLRGLPDWIVALVLFPLLWPAALSLAWPILTYALIVFVGLLDLICWPFLLRPAAVSAVIASRLERPQNHLSESIAAQSGGEGASSQSADENPAGEDEKNGWQQFLRWLATDFTEAFAAAAESEWRRWPKLIALVILLPCGLCGALVYFAVLGPILALLHVVYVFPRFLVQASQIVLELMGVLPSRLSVPPAGQRNTTKVQPSEHGLETRWWNWCRRIQSRWQSAGIPVLDIGPRGVDVFVPLYAAALILLDGPKPPSGAGEPKEQADGQPAVSNPQPTLALAERPSVPEKQDVKQTDHAAVPIPEPRAPEPPLFLERFPQAHEAKRTWRVFFVLGCAYNAGAKSLRQAEKMCGKRFALSSFNAELVNARNLFAEFLGDSELRFDVRGEGDEPARDSRGKPGADRRSIIALTEQAKWAWLQVAPYVQKHDQEEYPTYANCVSRSLTPPDQPS